MWCESDKTKFPFEESFTQDSKTVDTVLQIGELSHDVRTVSFVACCKGMVSGSTRPQGPAHIFQLVKEILAESWVLCGAACRVQCLAQRRRQTLTESNIHTQSCIGPPLQFECSELQS